MRSEQSALTPLVQVSGPSLFADSPIPDVGTTDNSEVEPFLAVDPTNTQHMVGAWIQDYARGIVAAVTFDGGTTWQSVPVPGLTVSFEGDYPHVSDPWLSFAPNGDLYLSSLGHDFPAFGSPTAVLVNKSTDGGLTWDAPVTVATESTGQVDKPSITTDPTDSCYVYATWVEFRLKEGRTTGTTMFSRTRDGGQTWDAPREIFDPGIGNVDQGHQIVVLPDGALIDFFTESVLETDFHIDLNLSLIRSANKGETWSTPVPAANIQLYTDYGYSLPGIPSPDFGQGVRATFLFFDVTVDATSGNLYAVWQDTRFGNSQYASIAFTMSTDGGWNWSDPIQVNQTPNDVLIGDRQAFLPSVAVAANGTVGVSYYDFRRNTLGNGLKTDVWLVQADPATGLTNPASWHGELRLTDKSFNMEDATLSPQGYLVGDYEGLVPVGNSFGALFSMPTKKDFDNVYFRGTVAPTLTSVQADPSLGIHMDGMLFVAGNADRAPVTTATVSAVPGAGARLTLPLNSAKPAQTPSVLELRKRHVADIESVDDLFAEWGMEFATLPVPWWAA